MNELKASGLGLVTEKYHRAAEDHRVTLAEAKDLVRTADKEKLNSTLKSGLYEEISDKIRTNELAAEKGVLGLFSKKIEQLKAHAGSESVDPEAVQDPFAADSEIDSGGIKNPFEDESPSRQSPPPPLTSLAPQPQTVPENPLSQAAKPQAPRLGWIYFKPEQPGSFRRQWKANPISLIASFNFLVGSTKFPQAELSDSATISGGLNAGVKLYNSFRFFFNYEANLTEIQIEKTHFELRRYRAGLGFNVPLDASLLNLKTDFLLGRGDISSNQGVSLPQANLEIEKLFSFGVSPRLCTLWDSICVGYQFSRDSITESSRLSLNSMSASFTSGEGQVLVRQHSFIFSLNLGGVIDWIWWRQARN